MKKLLKTTELVKGILEEQPETRDDDNLLWLEALRASVRERKNGYKMCDLTLAYVLKSVNQLGLPPFGTVARARRRLQAKYPELRGTEYTKRKRAERETVFKEYATNEKISI